jgi:SAM-dependent methyltransferase
MAHPAQREFCESIKKRFPESFKHTSVLDVGSLDINGTNRTLFMCCQYTGIDLGKGKGVDEISPVHLYKPDKKFDTIISTEALEHDEHLIESLKAMVELLRPGGLLLLTAATTGRPEHGTQRTTQKDSPFTPTYYKNVIKEDFDGITPYFENYEIAISGFDIYFWGIKKKTEHKITRPTLSILIPTLYDRAEKFSQLMMILGKQLTGEVELLTNIDDRTKTVGRKRQELLERSSGEYVVFVDDDDVIADDYVGSILTVLASKPDTVGFKAKIESLKNGKVCDVYYSIKYQYNTPEVNGALYRGTAHLTPIRRDIALRIGYKDISVNEDYLFSEQAVKLCKTEVLIDKFLYFYKANYIF